MQALFVASRGRESLKTATDKKDTSPMKNTMTLVSAAAVLAACGALAADATTPAAAAPAAPAVAAPAAAAAAKDAPAAAAKDASAAAAKDAPAVPAKDTAKPAAGKDAPKPSMSPLFGALDANDDAVIDAQEMAGAAAALKTLDKNGDGKLTPDEVRPPRPGFGGGAGRRGEGGGKRGGAAKSADAPKAPADAPKK